MPGILKRIFAILCDTTVCVCVCVCSYRSSFSIPRGLLWQHQVTKVSAAETTATNTEHRTQRLVASCSPTHCLTEYKSAINQTAWTPDIAQAVFLKKEPYWWNSDHLRDRPTGRQAGSWPKPPCSINSCSQWGQQNKQGRNIQSPGEGRLHTQMIFLHLNWHVMKNNTVGLIGTHPSYNYKNVIYANKAVTGLNYISENIISCSVWL